MPAQGQRTRTSNELTFRWGYYNEPHLRPRLNSLVREIFGGLDFSPWNDLGYVFSQYTPFSFFENDRVVANVCASPMNLVINNKHVKAVQIGTVATLPAFRGRGLIHALVEKAQAYWDKKRRLQFLFANDSASDFYPQFGFRRVAEHAFYAKAPVFESPGVRARKLELANPDDRKRLRRLVDNRTVVSSRLGVLDHTWLFLFHASTTHARHLSYIEALDVAVIHFIAKDKLHLVDVIGKRMPSLRQIYPFIGSPKVKMIEFHFTPDLLHSGDMNVEVALDSLLFVRGPFPADLEPFMFPATAQA